MKRSLVALTGAQVAMAVALLAIGDRRIPTGRTWLVVALTALAFAGAGHVAVHLELRRHAFTVTPAEGVLAIGLFLLHPVGLVLAVTAGSLLICSVHRLPAIKVVFNAAQAVNATAVAASVFVVLGRPGPTASDAALVVFAAAAAYFAVNVTSVGAAIAVSERRSYLTVLQATAAPALVATVGSTALGVLLAVLAPQGWTVILLIPVVILLMVSIRSVAIHRAERLRFERLYAASFRTGRLLAVEDALVTLGGEAMTLVTGSAALCAVQRPDGTSFGVIVNDDGDRPMTLAEMAAADALLAGQSPSAHARTCSRTEIPAILLQAAPDTAEAVAAISPAREDDCITLVVFRSLDQVDKQGHADVLAVFCQHAALTISNARLYQEVEDALRRQVDLNRQKDDFLAAVSHELRTPLTSVLGSVDTIARLGDRMPAERRVQFCTMAKNQGLRLKRLIEELLLVAAADAGAMGCAVGCIDVPRLMAALETEFGPICGERLQVMVDGATAPLFSDEDKIRRVLVNLIENAAKYAPNGPIEVRATRLGDRWTFSVMDHGVGIAPADRDRVFERFVQLDQSSTRRQGGTGLGLYLCHQIAEALGGTVYVTDVPGGGSCFILDIPTLVAERDAAPYLALISQGGS